MRTEPELLEAVERSVEQDRVGALTHWLRHWHDGRIKLAVTRALLELRAREPALFAAGDYAACAVSGPRADELVAFVRRHGPRLVLTAAQRFPLRAERSRDWHGTRIHVARPVMGAVDVLTGRSVRGDSLDPAELFATLPVAVLAANDADGEA